MLFSGETDVHETPISSYRNGQFHRWVVTKEHDWCLSVLSTFSAHHAILYVLPLLRHQLPRMSSAEANQ